MTVDQLRKALEGLSGDMIVVTSGRDHSYDRISVAFTCAAGFGPYGGIFEVYDELEDWQEDEGCYIQDVFFVDCC